MAYPGMKMEEMWREVKMREWCKSRGSDGGWVWLVVVW